MKLTIVPLRNVPIGFESFVPDSPGHYLLVNGEAILSTFALTYGGTGSVYALDVNPVELSDGTFEYDPSKIKIISPDNPASEEDYEVLKPGEAVQIFASNPVQVGAFHLGAYVKYGLVLVLSGGEHGIVPLVNSYYQPVIRAKKPKK